jgi:hypothetical protein
MFKLFTSKEAKVEIKGVVFEGMNLEQARVALLGLMAQEHINHHQMGQLYNYVVDNKLPEKAGYEDAKAWFREHLVDLSQTTLTVYGAVAKSFSESVAQRFGVTCLSLLLTYKEAADLEVNHEEPGGTLIEVPQANGQVVNKAFSQCSVDELRRAIQRKRKPSSSKPLPPEVVARADQYREAVTGRFPKGVLVKVAVRNEKGRAVLDFKGIPVELVDTLIEALSAKVPLVSEAPSVEKVLPLA